MAVLTRTATCRAGAAVETATGQEVSPAVLVERVGWLAALVAEVGQGVLDAHWDRASITAITAEELPGGRRMPSFGYKAAAALWGWAKPPTSVYASSRVVWMGTELAARQLRSAAYRMGVVDQIVGGADPSACADVVTGQNTRRQVGTFYDTYGRVPADLFELAPTPPRIPRLVPLAATDRQFSSFATADGNLEARVLLLLPTVPRPATRHEWSQVEVTVDIPDRYRDGVLRPPTLRVKHGRVCVDLPVEYPKPRLLPDNGRVMAGDWGTNRLLTATLVRRIDGVSQDAKAAPVVDGRPMFFDPSPLLSKSLRLTRERQHVARKRDQYQRLLDGRPGQPNPALEAKLASAQVQVARLNRKQQALNRQVAELAAVWLIAQAQAADAHTVAVENLKTLEHRGLGKKNNARVSMALRGQVIRAVKALAERHGIRVVEVYARGTSSNCSRCDQPVAHYAAPNGGRGYAWSRCGHCGRQAPRDHPAAEKIGQRAVAPKAKTVRLRRSKKTVLAPTPAKLKQVRGPKSGPTPKRPRRSSPLRPEVPRHLREDQARQRPGGAATSPHRSAGPETQDTPTLTRGGVQFRTEVPCPATLRVDGLRYAYRDTLRATPVLYRASTLRVSPV